MPKPELGHESGWRVVGEWLANQCAARELCVTRNVEWHPMNTSKRIPAAVIILVGCVMWFIPPPQGLREAGTIAHIAEQASGVKIWQAARILKADAATTDGDSVDDGSKIDGSENDGQSDAAVDDPAMVARVLAARDEVELDQPGQRAWRLFVLFGATIALILIEAMPVFTAAIGALALAVLTQVLTVAEGYSGFSQSFILLIVVAFTIAIGVAKSGLGERLAYIMISRFGRSTLGLGYSLVLTDLLIAPAFPSNTARSGVLFPIVDSVAKGSGSPPLPEERKKLGAYLVMVSIVGLSLSSALWLTAMAANPAGAELANRLTGESLGFYLWFKAASVPTLTAFVVLPYLLYVFFPPGIKQTPEAPEAAREKLRAKGPLSRDEKVMAVVFLVMVLFWALKGVVGFDSTAVAIAGLFALLLTGVITLDDVKGSNGPTTFAWFASLFTLSNHLNKFGFMHWVGECAAEVVAPFSWPVVYVALVVAYVLMHYFFVSQTAHMFAMFPIFLSVGITAGVPGLLLAMMLLQATNFFSPLTPQASSANAIFVGSGYVTTGEVYRYGGLIVLLSTVIYLCVGTPWMMYVL